MKKLFAFSITSLIIILIFFVSYNLVFKEASNLMDTASGVLSGDKKDSKSIKFSQEKIYRLTENSITAPVVDTDEGKIRFYDLNDSVFKMISFDKSLEKEFPDQDLPSMISNVFWSPNTKYSLIESDSGLFHYNHTERVVTKLKENIDFAIWSNLSNKIIYKYFNPETRKRSIDMATVFGDEWQKVADLDYKKVSMSPIPQSSLVSFWNYPDQFVQSSLAIANPIDESISFLFSDRKGSDYLWSPNGNKLLGSFVIENSMILGVSDRNGENYVDLELPTMASKCVWSTDNKNIFCAMPSNIPEGAIMPNDYLSKKVLTKDTFWKINTKNGEKKRLVELEDITETIDATSLLLSPEEDILFFINRHNNSLYRISL